MPCYHPLKAIVNGTTPSGKKNLKILSSGFLLEYQMRNGKPFPEDSLVTLPCGQCVGCRLEHSRQWANRCMLELKYHESAYFLTLTYNNDHVPVSYYSDPNTGEALEALTLRKRDFQLFMKRLRKALPYPIRFFMCGEYGSTTFRPHYHAIVFGLQLDDLKPHARSPLGYQYYTSDTLQKAWSDSNGEPIGYVIAGEVTWETCAYTARYVMKKLNGDLAKHYDFFNIEPEFTLMSRRPGIARQFFDDNPGIYDTEVINISTEKGGRQFAPPRYYDKLFAEAHPDRFEDIKAARQLKAVNAMKAQLVKTSLREDEYLSIKEHYKQNAIKSLRRDLL